MSRAPAIVSAGLCSCAGASVESAWNAVACGADTLERVRLFESPKHSERFAGFAKIAALPRGMSRCAAMMFSAIDEAARGFDLSAIKGDRISVYVGTSIGGIFETENMLERNASTGIEKLSELACYECSTLSELAAKRTGALGECAAFSTACSSSSIAIAEACNAIEQGRCDAAVVCGVDALSRITLNGFGSLLLLSRGKCAPFDKNRDGINLGEAAGALFLCAESKLGKAKPLAYITGWARTCDAHHATSPDPDGKDAARAIREALSMASVPAESVSYYNAHGTATTGNDSAEAAALRAVFGQNIPPVSSIKRIFGHTLGASGIVNAIISLESERRSILPPNAGFKTFDESLGIEPVTCPKGAKIENSISVSLGFGGNNGAIVISRGHAKCKAPPRNARTFIYGCGIVGRGGTVDDSHLMPDEPPLKKRKLAHLQKMGAHAARAAIKMAQPDAEKERTAVCWGTGLGMTAQTRMFVENIFAKREAEPMPTAFTNSVHNAVPSAIAIREGFRGLNSAVSAKEISFECALAQAVREINSGAADAAVVCAGDEYCQLAADFLKTSKYSENDGSKLSDFAAAYFIGIDGAAKSKPIAEILDVEICRLPESDAVEFKAISNMLASNGLAASDVSKWLSLKPCNAYQRRRLKSLADSLGIERFEHAAEKYGDNYCASAACMFEYAEYSGKICLQYSVSSTSMRAATLFKIL